MSDQVLHELSRLSINITKSEEATMSWHESYLSILTEKGVHVFEFSHNLQCLDKTIDCIQSFITHPKSSPATSLFTDTILNKELKNIHLTEMIVDHSLWPHNPQLLHEMSSIIDFKWSPVGVVNNHDSAVAVLTNVGVVEIYIQHHFIWECALQISTLLSKECRIAVAKPKDYETLKETVYMLATTAMCWAPTINHDNSGYFVTTQKNGNIILWLMECRERNASVKILGSIKSNTFEIVSIVWVPLNNERFLLVCANVLGHIIALECQIQNNVLELLQSHTLWSHKDRMIAKLVQYIKIDNDILLICNKHRHLLVLMIDNECNILGHYLNNINDYRITSIAKAGNQIFVTTVNRDIYQLNIAMADKELDMDLTLVQYQNLSSTYELYGIGYSPNNVFSALCVCDRKVNCKKDPTKVEIILMSSHEKTDSILDMLLLNPTKQMTGYWDVIELLRYKTMKMKEAPSIDYPQLYEMACSNVYMLKFYLILITLCDNLKRTFKIGPDFILPEHSVEVGKEEILVAHADKLVQEYYQKFQENSKLEAQEQKYFLGAKKYLEYFFVKNNRDLSVVMDSSIWNIINDDVTYICQWCDEIVTGFTCKKEHRNMFCALTFTPIESSSYLVCKWCNLTAQKELLSEQPMCLFCDVHLKLVRE